MIQTLNQSTPSPIVPKNMKKLKFLDIDVTEFARQLTIIESRLYGKIKAAECLNKTWQKKVGEGEPDAAPNVKALILHSNQMTNWVAEMILAQQDVKKRVVVIKHFVSVADVSPYRLPLFSQGESEEKADSSPEMPRTQQLFDVDVDHLRPWHRADSSAEAHLGPGPTADARRAGNDAPADGQHQELWRVS